MSKRKQSKAKSGDAHAVVTNLSASAEVTQLPANNAQTRPLADLSPKEQSEVWNESVETAPVDKVTSKKRVTGQHVKDTKERLGEERQNEPTNIVGPIQSLRQGELSPDTLTLVFAAGVTLLVYFRGELPFCSSKSGGPNRLLKILRVDDQRRSRARREAYVCGT